MVSSSPYETVNTNKEAGAVYFYINTAGVWTQQSRIVPNVVLPNALFGSSVAVYGDYLAVGSPGTPAVYIFIRVGLTWNQQAKLVAPGAVDSDAKFGALNGVALDGTYLAIGSKGLETVFVYKRTGTNWSLVGTLRSSDYFEVTRLGITYVHKQEFGCSVSLSGSTLVIGAQYADYDKTQYSDIYQQWYARRHHGGKGAVYIYYKTGSADISADWSEQVRLQPKEKVYGERFGFSVALDGDSLVVGAPGSPSAPTVAWDFESGDLTVKDNFNNHNIYIYIYI